MSYKPIIIIGAPRSGTNMLRDTLCKLPDVGTWPCDEINYIWRHGNVKFETDEFKPEMATFQIKQYILNQFNDIAKKNKLNYVVEKTCASSLRVPFVNEVLPDAKYIFIVRDGLDVVGSATIRWKAKINLPYLLKKVSYVPLRDLPYYFFRYIGSRFYKFFSKEKRLSFWGPQFKGLESSLKNHTLEEVCGLQWKRCVDLSEDAFSTFPNDKMVRVTYEEFVSNPQKELVRILQFLNIRFDQGSIKDVVNSISNKSIGKGKKTLEPNQLNNITDLLSDTLERYGYKK